MSAVRKRSISIRGHRTSFSIEDAFMVELERIADLRDIALASLVSEVDAARGASTNLSSALRLFVLQALKADANGSPLGREP